MTYLAEAGTSMLATNCIFCGRSLRDPASVERGCGPYCAEKWGVFELRGERNDAALAEALATAPEAMREAIQARLDVGDDRKAVSAAIHVAGNAWEHEATDWGHYVGSAMEIATALGYPGTAMALTKIFISGESYDEEGNLVKRGKPRGILVSDLGDGRWRIELPYLDTNVWRPTMDRLKAAGVQNRKVGGSWQSSFRGTERDWLLVLNAMVPTLAGTLGRLPSGETFLVPAEPVPVPEPLAAEAPAGVGPERGTSPEPGTLTKDSQTVEPGDRIWYREDEMVVAWVSPDRVRVIALSLANAEASMRELGYLHGKRFGGITMGMRDVRFTAPTAAEKTVVEEDTGPLKRDAKDREFPESLFPYQREAALWLCDRGSGILAYDQGTGKTAISLSAADEPVLIVCKSALKVNWLREVARWRPNWTSMKLEGKDAKKPAVIEQARKVDALVVNFDVADRFVDLLEGREFKTIIVDESHYIKTLRLYWKKGDQGRWEPKLQGSKRAQAVWWLAQPIERRFMLSGTPIANKSPCDLFSQLNLADSKEFRSFKPFGERYCDPQEIFAPGGRRIVTYEGASNTLELHEKITGKYLIRKTKEEVLPDLPKKWRQTKLLTLTEAIAKEYESAADNLLAYIQARGGWEAMDRAARAEAMVRIATLRRLCAVGKVEGFVEEVSEQLSSGRPLVIMAYHREAQISIFSALEAQGVRVGRVSTDAGLAENQRAIDRFQQGGPEGFLDALVCSIEIAKEGLTLTRASEMYFLERVWSPFTLMQAEDRIHRIGATGDKVTITYFDAAGTIDETIGNLLMKKLRTSAEVLSGVELSDDEVAGVLFGERALSPNARMVTQPDWAQPES
jgi:SWI/SNF-related matrix-associated actin-dependent regulator 1 of chromatin subfamily A